MKNELASYLNQQDVIIETGLNTLGEYVKCSNGKLVIACDNGHHLRDAINEAGFIGYPIVIIGQWK